MKKGLKSAKTYWVLLNSISSLLEHARAKAYSAVNEILVNTYWEVGQQIVEFEQKGKEKAEYGSQLLDRLASDLKIKAGKGFSRSNLYLMRLFYLKYPKIQTTSGKLSWSHYAELLGISDDLARGFYEQQCLVGIKW